MLNPRCTACLWESWYMRNDEVDCCMPLVSLTSYVACTQTPHGDSGAGGAGGQPAAQLISLLSSFSSVAGRITGRWPKRPSAPSDNLDSPIDLQRRHWLPASSDGRNRSRPGTARSWPMLNPCEQWQCVESAKYLPRGSGLLDFNITL